MLGREGVGVRVRRPESLLLDARAAAAGSGSGPAPLLCCYFGFSLTPNSFPGASFP